MCSHHDRYYTAAKVQAGLVTACGPPRIHQTRRYAVLGAALGLACTLLGAAGQLGFVTSLTPSVAQYHDSIGAEAMPDIPVSCIAWFDGCNHCEVAEGALLACTLKYCIEPEGPPQCVMHAEAAEAVTGDEADEQSPGLEASVVGTSAELGKALGVSLGEQIGVEVGKRTRQQVGKDLHEDPGLQIEQTLARELDQILQEEEQMLIDTRRAFGEHQSAVQRGAGGLARKARAALGVVVNATLPLALRLSTVWAPLHFGLQRYGVDTVANAYLARAEQRAVEVLRATAPRAKTTVDALAARAKAAIDAAVDHPYSSSALVGAAAVSSRLRGDPSAGDRGQA